MERIALLPTIDLETCTGSGACAEFCSNDVFAFIDGVMTVANPRNCVPFCDGCAGECPVSAIMFSPKENLLL